MWSNPDDIVLSPFAGIGSEGYVALKLRRKFVGVELKESYFRVAAKHLSQAEANAVDLFDASAA
jgi:DNA modification methylase